MVARVCFFVCVALFCATSLFVSRRVRRPLFIDMGFHCVLILPFLGLERELAHRQQHGYATQFRLHHRKSMYESQMGNTTRRTRTKNVSNASLLDQLMRSAGKFL